MQAAFRSQNSYHYEEKGKYYKKENAYIFDFAPDRTLVMFDDFANKLVGDGSASDKERPENIKRLLNFFRCWYNANSWWRLQNRMDIYLF
jgi:hypothetical protein